MFGCTSLSSCTSLTHRWRTCRAVQQRRRIATNLFRQHERRRHIGERFQTVGQLTRRDAQTVDVRLLRVAEHVLLQYLGRTPVQVFCRRNGRCVPCGGCRTRQLVERSHPFAVRHQTDALAKAAQQSSMTAHQNVAGTQRPVHEALAVHVVETEKGVAQQQRHNCFRKAGDEEIVEQHAT